MMKPTLSLVKNEADRSTRTPEERNMQRLYQACLSPSNKAINIADYSPLGNWLDIGMQLYQVHTEGGYLDVRRRMVQLRGENYQAYKALVTLAGDTPPAEPEASAETTELPDYLTIGKQGRPIYKTLSEDDIEAFPDIEYQIEGLLQTATVSLQVGPSNTGKTFVALDMAECIARGDPWLGRRVKQGSVLYIYAESKIGLKPRLQAWKKYHNAPSTPNLKFITVPVQLINDKQWLMDTIAEQGDTPAMIVIDTFSNCSLGINQNDQAEVFKVLATAHEIVREFGSHVMIVHHENNTGKFNGSAAFKNHVDTMMQLNRADKDAPIIMRCEKQRDAERFDDIALQLQVVDLYVNPATLQTVTSCVVVAGSVPSQEKPSNATEQNMLGILTMNGRMSYNQWRKACEDAAIAKSTSFYTYVGSLLTQGKIKKDDSQGKGKFTWYEVVQKETSSGGSPELVQQTSSDGFELVQETHLILPKLREATSSSSSEVVQTEPGELGTN